MSYIGPGKAVLDLSTGSGHTFATSRHHNITNPIASKRVCFYKSGDPQFNGLPVVINNRTFKTFDALLDSLSKRVPLPFGVRNITTPRGIHAVHTLDELEDGKAYICSDKRKIKPINLALANKKSPPWYHARPLSARRQARKQESGFFRTPKRLVVFRNGDATVKHTVILRKKTTPTFRSLLDYMSELMQFPVVKLHTLDGRRVDGLPALIMCSGTVVAAGREPFKYGNYNIPTPTWLPPSRISSKRRKTVKRKKKSMSVSSKSRNFSSSSERHFVNEIHNSIAGSLCDLPRIPSGSVELETSQLLESVAETEGDTCLGVGCCEAEGSLLPTDDDIEKSFRVNQDGSMTVEMKVRLTIKEEETISWTTTLTRSSVANQTSVAGSVSENSSPDSSTTEPKDTWATDPVNNRHNPKDDDDDDPPSMDYGIISGEGNEDDSTKRQSEVTFPKRAATPGPRGISKRQDPVECVTKEEVEESMVGSYSYRENMANGAVTEQYCLVRQCNARPVPKPRSGPTDNSTRNHRNPFQSEDGAEVLQVENRDEEIRETEVHIYEQQSSHDNHLANSHFSAQGMYGLRRYGRPATADTARLSSSNDYEAEQGRPSTASESVNLWREENISLYSDLTLSSLNTRGGNIPSTKPKVMHSQKFPLSKCTKDKTCEGLMAQSSKSNYPQKVKKAKQVSPKKKVKKNISQSVSPEKNKKDRHAEVHENRKKVQVRFSSTASIRKIYGYRPKTVKSLIMLKKKQQEKVDRSLATTSPTLSSNTSTFIICNQSNITPVLKGNLGENEHFETNVSGASLTERSETCGILTGHRSVYEKGNTEKANSSMIANNDYVENWLEKVGPILTEEDPGGKMQNGETPSQVATRGDMYDLPDVNCEVISAAEMPSPLDKEKTLNCPSLENLSSSSLLKKAVIHENVSSENPLLSLELTPSVNNTQSISDKILLKKDSTEDILHYNGQPNALENSLSFKNISLPYDISTGLQSDSGMEKEITKFMTLMDKKEITSTSNLPKTTPLQFETSVEKPPQYERVFDASSVGSQCCTLSSKSRLFSEDSTLSITPPSNEAPAPTNRTLNTEGISVQREVSLSRTASVKKGRLVSNISFEKKMSLQKASSDKSALTTESTLERAVSLSPVDVPMVTLSYDLPSNRTSLPTSMSVEKTPLSDRVIDMASLTSSSSLYMSASPISLTSEERALPVSPPGIEVPSPSNPPLDGVIAIPTSSNSPTKEETSPKLIKKAKLISNLSLEKKPSLGKASSEKSKLPVVTAGKTQVPGSPSLLRDKSLKTFHNVSLDKATSPTRKEVALNNSPSTAVEQNGSPSKGQSPSPQKSRMINRLYPYSQSLDVASPPMKIKSKTKSLTKNHSFDNMSEASNLLIKKTPSPKKRCQTKVLPIPTSTPFDSYVPENAGQEKENKANKSNNNADENAIAAKQSLINIQSPPQSPKMAAQPNIKPVLERLCHSVKSIRNITQTKRGSCLGKSNSMPDFSSHVASTFGSSSKALLAFLSVMTLKEGITNSNIQELKANSISCVEALKMMESLREIANIEDANELKASLTNLQKSTSTQLLQSWKAFQDLNEKYNILSPSPNYSEQELEFKPFPEEECSIMENSIDELINKLDVPEMLKEELADFPLSIVIENDKLERYTEVINKVESVAEKNIDTNLSLSIKEENPSKLPNDSSVDVKSIISRFKKLNQANETNDNLLSLRAGTPNMKRSIFKSEPNVKHMYGDTQAKERSFQRINSGCEEPKTMKKHRDQNEEEISYEKHHDSMERNIPEKSSHKDPEVECMNMKASNEEGMTSPEKDHSISDKVKPDIECKELGMSTEESLSIQEYENSDEKEDDFTSYTKLVLEKFVGEDNVTNNEEDQCSSEEEQCVVKSGELQVNDKKDNSIPDTHSEERDNKLLITTNSMGFNDGTEESMSSPDMKDWSSSLEDQPEVEFTDLEVTNQNALFNCSPEKEEHNNSHTNDSLKFHISREEGESSPEVCYQSETEDPMVESKELTIIPEKSTFTLEGDQYLVEEEQKCHSENQTNEEEDPWMKLQVNREYSETMNLQVNREYSETTPEHVTDSSEAESQQDDLGYPDSEMCFELTEKEKLPTQCKIQISKMKEHEKYSTKAKLGLTTHSSTAEEHYSFDIDQDSGNDPVSCEEHATDVNQTHAEDHPFGPEEDEIGYDDKRSSLEEEHYVTKQSVEESYKTHQEHYAQGKLSEEESNHDVTKEKPTFQSETNITQSVADRVNLLEKKVTSESQRKREMLDNSRSRRVAQRDVACLSSSAVNTSTPQSSSLAFNYDCHGIMTSQPEGNMVRSIKEMFLAKTVDSQNGQKRFPSPSTSDLSGYRPETSASSGYRSQTSSELSSGEDDTARKSIVEGFVRRTIERLYGKRGDSCKVLSNERPPSASKHGQKESASIFSPFHAAQTKMMPDLSYFNANHPFESFSEQTRCVAFNAQVGPGDSVSIDQGRWLIRENNAMRKSISDPIGINKNLEPSQKNKKMCENASEDAPYSHFSVKSDQEEKLKFAAAKCTYFSLPNASDSDVYQDDLSTESKSNAKGDNTGENEKSKEDPKTGAERNVILTAFTAPDFKMVDNKVHPMVECPPDGQVVVVQPAKGQSTAVNRRPQEPDALEMLYIFCGQHCPVL